jgi:hypothetical protein
VRAIQKGEFLMNILRTLIRSGIFLTATAALSHGSDGQFSGPTAYEVPVLDAPELAPYAHYEMAATVKVVGEHLEFCYRLPEDLVGPDKNVPTIEFITTEKLSENTYRVKGKHSNGKCTFGKKASCHLTYHDLNLNAETTKAFLATKFSGIELEKHSEVAVRFAFDPEGILLFTDSGSDTAAK